MKIEALKAQCDWIVQNQELYTHTEAQLASTLPAGIADCEVALEGPDVNHFERGMRHQARDVLRAMEDAT